jgi:hypothetical protein
MFVEPLLVAANKLVSVKASVTVEPGVVVAVATLESFKVVPATELTVVPTPMPVPVTNWPTLTMMLDWVSVTVDDPLVV